MLAIVETMQALVAPRVAPTTADWRAAARHVRAGFRAGDLLVAAPAWADPLLRLHLGDLLPVAVAGRMDDARYGRVWEVSQRAARAVVDPAAPSAASDPTGDRVAEESRWGALTVRLIERRAAVVTFDFLERWQAAAVSQRDLTGAILPCPWQGNRFACPGGNTVQRQLVEVDTRIRRALLAPPVPSGTVRLEFSEVALGTELALAAGLHDVWARKVATGTVHVETWIAGARANEIDVGNRSGWRLIRIDTAAHAGEKVSVRFDISSARPDHRLLAFAAEARR